MRRRPEAVEPRLEPVGLIDAVLALIEASSGLLALDQPLAAVCRQVDACGGVFSLAYSDIASTDGLLTALMSDRAFGRFDARATWAHVPPAAAVTSRASGGFVRSAYVDAVASGGEILVLLGGIPVRLSGVGATIWEQCEEPTTVDKMVDAAVAAHGEHPDAPQLVARAVDELVAAGALSEIQ